MDGLTIRSATLSDRPRLRAAVVELQDHESRLHPTRLRGDQIADAYLAWMAKRAGEHGAVLIAEIEGAFAGFVAGWIEEESHIEETPDSNRFGYVSDICVLPAHRGQRIASRLLEAMEHRLCGEGVTRIRLFTLAGNRAARASYERSGYAAYEVVYEKSFRPLRASVGLRPRARDQNAGGAGGASAVPSPRRPARDRAQAACP
jgi:ribosomal protein S18 acetylase RimI-like enzyme